MHLLLLRLLTNFYPSPQYVEEGFLTFPSLASFFSKRRAYLSVRRERTWEMGAVLRLILNLSIKWRSEVNFKTWPVLSW